jgi:cytochrome c553
LRCSALYAPRCRDRPRRLLPRQLERHLRQRVGLAALIFLPAVLGMDMAWAQKTADAARGSIKAAACAVCHGSPEQPAQPGIPSLAGQQHEFLVLQMFYLREGLRAVPAMAGMLQGCSDRDLEDVAVYYARQQPAVPSSKPQEALRARGEALSKQMGCRSCHLDNYRGQKHVPAIARQREDYLISAMKAYRDNKRTGTDTSMNAALYRVSDADIEALAHYLAQHP